MTLIVRVVFPGDGDGANVGEVQVFPKDLERRALPTAGKLSHSRRSTDQ